MPPRRKHYKVDEYPEELRQAIHEQLIQGTSYREIAERISQQGYETSKSAIGRYGKDFLTRMETLRRTREQARVIVEDDPDAPATQMAEAANQLAVQLIMETLLKMPDLAAAKTGDLLKALALLERSGVAREKLKMDFRKKADGAVQKIEEVGKARGLSEEDLRVIKEQVYGIAG